MAFQVRIVIYCLVTYNIVGTLAQKKFDVVDPEPGLEGKNTCSTHDLNHSKLVECNVSDCDGVSSREAQLWPDGLNSIVHMYSSRSGDRFVLEAVKNINYFETIEQRWYDINTTFYVDTRIPKQAILGFGTKLTINELIALGEEEDNVSIFRDLYAIDHSGIHFSILVVPITAGDLLDGQISLALKRLDRVLAEKNIGSRIRIILKLAEFEREALKSLTDLCSGLSRLKCWALAAKNNNSPLPDNPGTTNPIENTFASLDMRQVNSLDFDSIKSLSGLLIKSKFSTPYDMLNYVRRSNKDMSLITIGDDKPHIIGHGDWQNAQNHAVEILKHLESGINGFTEESSVSEVSTNPLPRDTSIYSLHKRHTHFRGPMFYAIGHFSRHVVPGSKRLASSVFTQPNMFAAHYQAFLTPDNHVVAIILNDNEHLLPFRLAVNDRIIANIYLKPKSFNTVVVKA